MRGVRALGLAMVGSAFATALCGCVTERVLTTAEVEASGPGGAVPWRFDQVSFDLERHSGAKLPVFCVRLAHGGTALRTDQLTPAIAAAVLHPWRPPASLSASYYEAWPSSDPRTHQMYIGNGYWMSFRDGRLVAMSVEDSNGDNFVDGQAARHGGVVGPTDCAWLRPLPIDSETFVAIFGSPARTSTRTRN